MNTFSAIAKNIIVICCIQIFHFMIQVLYYLVVVNVEPVFIFSFFFVFGFLYLLPFMFGTLISIVIMPKILQVIISQTLFIIVMHVFGILIDIKNIHIMSVIIQWIFIANLASIPIVLFINFITRRIFDKVTNYKED